MVLKNRKRMLKEPRYHYACHEAAHAIVCLEEDLNFECIRLCDEETNSPNGLGPATRHGQFVPTNESMTRQTAFSETRINLAGVAFEKLLRPHHSYAVICVFGKGASDWHGAMESCEFGLYDKSKGNEIERFMFKHLYPPVRALVAERWSDIATVGDALAQCGKLNQAEVIHVLSGKRPKARP